MRFSTRLSVVLVVLVAALWAGPGAAAGTPAAEAPAAPVKVRGAWARSTPPGAENGVVYLRIASARADRLVAVTVAPDVAAGAELHASMGGGGSTGGMANMPGMGGSGDGGTMQMRTLAAVRLPAGRTVVFEPGGRHVMLVGLARTLTRGDTFPVTLRFERAPEQVVTVKVRDTAP